jgi:hypothetical protein
MAAVDRCSRPVDLTGGVELGQQLVVQLLPDTGLLPRPKPPPAGDPRAVAELLGKVAPRDPGVQHVQDPVERLAIIERESTRVPETALADGGISGSNSAHSRSSISKREGTSTTSNHREHRPQVQGYNQNPSF